MATNLLLLDESLLVQRVVELAFRNTRVDIHMAEDADAALEMAENAPPDIVVASLDMENSDGLDFCRRLREKPGLSQVPLLVLTSTRNSVSDEKIQEVGATGNIEKPFKPIVFTTEVERILGPGAGVPTPDRKEQAEPDFPEKAMDTEAAESAPAFRGHHRGVRRNPSRSSRGRSARRNGRGSRRRRECAICERGGRTTTLFRSWAGQRKTRSHHP